MRLLVRFLFSVYSITVIRAEQCDGLILLSEAIDVLNKTLDYMKNVTANIMIVDGILGIRMVDDQLEMIMESNNSLRSECFRTFLSQISELQKKAETIANEYLEKVIELDPGIPKKEQDWLSNGRWKLNHRDTITDKKLIYEYTTQTDFTTIESTSDSCAFEVTGEWGRNSCSCGMSEKCWKVMTSFNHKDYWITHQVLYLESAEMCGCTFEIENLIEKFNQGNLQDLYNVFCSNILQETEIIAENNFTESLQDLFAEQIVVCGMIGFREFFRTDWLKVILSWQRPNYCFGTDNNKNYFEDTYLALEKERMEVFLENNCLIHKTAVAIGAIAVSIRLMITESRI